jgi:hypothetical protein
MCWVRRHGAPVVINNPVINNGPIINNIEQINNTNVIQPIFTKHGKEYIDHITKDVMLTLLNNNNFTDMASDLMRLMYFNVNVPQNSNWMIAYPKNQKAGVVYNYNTHEFERKGTAEIIDDKFSNMIDLLQPLIEQIYQEDQNDKILNLQQKKNINKYYEHVGMLEISKESPELFEKIRDMAFNHKTIATKSWKNQGLDGKHLSIKF